MSDVIKLLPDSVANQIAAGEVIQRPASAVKELLENAIDARSSSIQLLIKDGGKAMIQVVDNGAGMSETDARMCWERHATSKINKVEDIYAIKTMGFRGEALASIASIAKVEMRTRRSVDELGIFIVVEGSEVTRQEMASGPQGTSITIRNLFFNVPARRNFLKSTPVETRHIIDEFNRISLAHPEIEFTLYNNDNEAAHYKSGSLEQRIVEVLGEKGQGKLIALEETTSILQLSGFVGSPDLVKKTRGEQFFFVNKRFIKDPYLNHAIVNCYENLIPKGTYPFYLINIEIDPSAIDVNIHPTKTEIKFEDEKAIYLILKSVVKKALAHYTVTPEFDSAGAWNFIESQPVDLDSKGEPRTVSSTGSKSRYNPTIKSEFTTQKQDFADLEKLLDTSDVKLRTDASNTDSHQINVPALSTGSSGETDAKKVFQLHNRYVLTQVKSGLTVIDQQAAHERILYEKYLQAFDKHDAPTQQKLFPRMIEFSAADYQMICELMEEIKALGFDIAEFGNNTLVVNGIPADIQTSDEQELLEGLLEHFKQNQSSLKLDKRENLARSLAKKASVKSGTTLDMEEMLQLIEELFACENPYHAPHGKPTIITFALDQLEQFFQKNRSGNFKGSIDTI